jgi:hypothetical protein
MQTLRLDVTAGSGPPDQTCAIHNRMDELLVEKHTVFDVTSKQVRAFCHNKILLP